MDVEAAKLQKALDVLRQSYGEQLVGPQDRTTTQIRTTLERQLGIDAVAAGQVIRQLYDANRLVYVSTREAPTQAGTNTGSDTHSASSGGTTDTGPVISMPLTQSADGGAPLITTASPAMVMGIVEDRGGDVGDVVETSAEAAPEPSTSGEHAEGERTQGYWRIG